MNSSNSMGHFPLYVTDISLVWATKHIGYQVEEDWRGLKEMSIFEKNVWNLTYIRYQVEDATN